MSSPARLHRFGRAAVACALLCAAAAAPAADDFAAALTAARELAGVEPSKSLAALAALRSHAAVGQRLDARLAVDEAECRVLTDLDAGKAREVADAGLAAAGAQPVGAARDPWLRLRACRAGMLVELGEIAAGRGEFEALLQATADPADAGARALVLVERGAHRSRSGDLLGAQRDLIEACGTLRVQGPPATHELCLSHLAGHYNRIGDFEEAARLHTSLLDGARRRGAVYDESIYTYALAQACQGQERWAEAVEGYRQAAAAALRAGDPLGVAYADHGLGLALLRQGRFAEALEQAEKALKGIGADADPRQHENARLTHAEALLGLGRSAQAQEELAALEAPLRRRGASVVLVPWLLARSQALAAQGRWQAAYQAQDEARRLQHELHRQQLSDQSARVRAQFNRDRDAEDLTALRRLNEQQQELRRTQAVALLLFVLLLAAAIVYGLRKFRQARHLQGLASTDELTGLANRRALLAATGDALARARRESRPLALLMIDVDHFKRINDTHGHAVGDEVLRHLARVLGAGLRERDRLGRLGGEEFLALLPDATPVAAGQVAERMRAAIAATPLVAAGGPVALSVSIGVASALPGEPAEALIERADAAMYRAKHAGRNTVVVDAPRAEAA